MKEEGDAGGVVRESMLERRPSVSAVRADRIEEGFDQHGISLMLIPVEEAV